MSLNLYRIAQSALSPVISLYLGYRKIIGKEDVERFNERLGHVLTPRPGGGLLWAHAASVGEAVSIIPLLKMIEDKYPHLHILVTTGTVTSAKLMQKKLPKEIVHQFVPVDMLGAVRRFLNHWRPDIALWVESELWPNLICETASSGCPIILVNARMSLNSLTKWKRYKSLAGRIFGCFAMCLAQSEEEAERFREAGVNNTFAIGNLKYESPPLPSDPEEMTRLVKMIGGRHTWAAASTSEGEEEIAGRIHEHLKKDVNDLLTIIVPRHPERGGEIKRMLSAKGLKVALRSDKDEITPETDIYLADTIGELGIFYRLTSIVFMGGSLVPHGGQNPLEPARLDCAIISGDNIKNFKEVYSEMAASDAVIMVENETQLLNDVEALMKNQDTVEKMVQNASMFVRSKSGILDKYMSALQPYLKPFEKYVAENS